MKIATPPPLPQGTGSGSQAGSGAQSGAGPTPDEPLPRRLGKYILFRKLAIGGMAELFLALQRSVAGFEKLVVVKRILPHVAKDKTFIEMLLREARIAATLSHPNVVQIFDVGEVNGSYFIAMEHVHGEDLRSIVRAMKTKSRTSFPMEHAVAIVLGLAAGLAYAHDKRDLNGQPLHIVHRDISPQNVLVTFTGDIKIVDFGIALAGRTQPDQTGEHGKLRGKIPYMSPEQARGEVLDGRSDIFSAGILLFELCTGKRLFRGPNEVETLRMIVESPYPTPRQVRPSIPETLDGIIRKALERDRAKRYQSAREMQRDLEGFIRDNRIAASPIAIAGFMKDLYEEALLSHDEALQEGKRMADLLEEREPDPSMSFHNLAVLPNTDGSGASVPLSPAPAQSSALGKLLAAGAFVAVLLAVGGLLLWRARQSGVPDSDNRGVIVVESTPSGGSVWLDGQPTGQHTPARLTKLPLNATYSVRVTAERLAPYTQQVRLAVRSPTATVRARLATPTASSMAMLRVSSSPPGAKIYFDGRDTGRTTPATLPGIDPGVQHRLMVERDGFLAKALPVTLAVGQVENLDLALERRPLLANEAMLVLRVSPATARVEVEGQVVQGNDVREQLLRDVRSAHIVVTASGYQEERRAVRLELGRERELRIELRREPEHLATGGQHEPQAPTQHQQQQQLVATGPGHLTFGAVPWCNVTVDGRRVGQTPIVNLELPAGSHTVVCNNPDLGITRSVSVRIEPGQSVRRRITLQQAPTPE